MFIVGTVEGLQAQIQGMGEMGGNLLTGALPLCSSNFLNTFSSVIAPPKQTYRIFNKSLNL